VVAEHAPQIERRSEGLARCRQWLRRGSRELRGAH
jgi:hypothetical protein